MFACLYMPPSAMRGASPPLGEGPDAAGGFITRSRGQSGRCTQVMNRCQCLLDIARMVSPRWRARRHQVVIDIEGLERLSATRVLSASACARPRRTAASARARGGGGHRTAAMLLAAAHTGDGRSAGKKRTRSHRSRCARSRCSRRRKQKQKQEARSKKTRLQIPSPSSQPLGPSLAPSAYRLVLIPSPWPRAPSPEPESGSLAVIARWGLRTLGELAALPAADLSNAWDRTASSGSACARRRHGAARART